MINFQNKKLPVRKRPVYNPFEEPGRILKTAGEHVTGSPAEDTQEPVTVLQPEAPPEEIAEARHRARLKQLRQEVAQKINERREEEKRERQDEEIAKLQQKKKLEEQKLYTEPSTKRPRGILAGMAGVVKKLQSRVETGPRKQQ